MKEKLKEIITLKIETLKENSSKYMDIYKAVLSVIDDISNLKAFDLEKLSFLELDSEDFNRLIFYKKLLSDGVYELEPSDIEYIKNFFLSIKTKVSFYIEDNLINIYQNLLDKLDNYEFNQNDIELICTLLREEKDKGNDVDIISYMKRISLEMMEYTKIDVTLLTEKEKNEEQENKEENEELIITNLSTDDLITLFNKYGIDYMSFNKESRELMEKYGKYDNIDEILDLFINKEHINVGSYVKIKSKQLANIFIYSNYDLISNVFDKLKECGINIISHFKSIISSPSKFIPRKRRYLGKGDGASLDFNGEIGHNEDFLKNIHMFREAFKEINVDDISSVYEKCSSIFDLSYRHNKNALKQFDLYHIKPECYLKALSSFRGFPADAIDAFIESDYNNYGTLEYLWKNPSKFSLNPYSSIFYKLYMARKKGYTKEQLFSSRGFKFYDSNFLDINNDNGSEIVEQYFPDNPKFLEYENAIKESDNSDTMLTAFKPNKLIIDVLDEKYLDNDVCYIINGIRISRFKVQRFLNTLILNRFDIDKDALLYCVTKNSILNEEEYKVLEDEISKLFVSAIERRK